MSSFQINTNIGALKAYNALARLNERTAKAQLRLATQKRINHVADDTSGFNVGKSLEAKVSVMKAAQNNVGSAKDMLSTAESQLINMKDLITQIRGKIADAGNPAADTDAIAADIKAIAEEIGSAFATTKFNDTHLLISSTSGAGSGFVFQTGADTSDTLTVDYATGIAGDTDLDIGSIYVAGAINADIAGALDYIDDNIGTTGVVSSDITGLSTSLDTFEDAVTAALGKIGNLMQRLDVKEDFLTSAIANSQASVSRLFDADMAMEQLNATRSSIGSQAATAMLAQLNFAPSQVLQLFG